MSEDLVQTIFARRSIRRYTAEPVSGADIKTLLEAAMAAPSASNRKPWSFVVVTERQTLDRLAEVHPHGKMLFEAVLCRYRESVAGSDRLGARRGLAGRLSQGRQGRRRAPGAGYPGYDRATQPDLYRPSGGGEGAAHAVR